MNPEHASTRSSRQCGGGEGALESFRQSHTKSLPDEILVAQRHQHGPPGINEIVYVAQQSEPVEGVFAEVMRRIDQNRVLRHPQGERPLGGRGHFVEHRPHDAVDLGSVMDAIRPGTRYRATGVGAHQSGAVRGRHGR